MNEMTIRLDTDELLGLQAVIAASADTTQDPRSVALEYVRAGLLDRLDELGLPWAPNPEQLGQLPAPAQLPLPTGLHTLWGNAKVRSGLRAAIVVAALICLSGGYAGGWSWTGFRENKQLWDWLQLLLLPVAFATLPLWLTHSSYLSRTRKAIYAGVVVAFAAFVVIGYEMPLGWTGFTGNKLWDWLTLILLPVTLITVRTWTSTSRTVRAWHVVAAGALAAGWIVTVVGGYAWGWSWTGYQGNTLWDWLQLVLLPIIFPTILAPAMLAFVTGNVEERVRAERSRAAHHLDEPPAG